MRRTGENAESIPLLSATSEPGEILNEFSDPAFTGVVRSVERAIEDGILPDMIPQGTSGSYFAKNGDKVGITQ